MTDDDRREWVEEKSAILEADGWPRDKADREARRQLAVVLGEDPGADEAAQMELIG